MMSSKRDMANAAVLGIFGFLFLAVVLIIIGFLGIFLLPLSLVFIFLLAVYFTRGYGFTGITIIGGILLFFLVGLGIHFVLGSVIGFDPVQTTYQSSIALSSTSLGISDTTFGDILGVGLIVLLVVAAMLGLLMQTKRRH